MLKNLGVIILALFLLGNLYGCFAVVAGAAAGGAGTAAWLSGKLSQEVDVSVDKAISASERALGSFGLRVEKKTVKDDVAQIISSYIDGKTIWIDIRPLTNNKSRIDVRVGATGDKEAAQKILDKILKYTG